MTRTVRGVLETPNILRLDEAVELPLHAPVEVAITEPESENTTPNSDVPESTFTKWALSRDPDTLPDLPADYSECWKEYLAEEERERNR